MKRWVTSTAVATGAAAALIAGTATPSFAAAKPANCPSYPPRPVQLSVGYDRVNNGHGYELVGRVFKNGCGGVPNVVVHFFLNGKPVGKDATGPHGYAFKFKQLPPGEYTVKVTYKGHTSTETFRVPKRAPAP